MSRHLVAVLVILATVGLAPAENAADPPPDKPLVVKLAPSASTKKTRALKYTLLPDELDLKPGNAATFWRRSGRAAMSVKRRMTDKEYLWISSDTALKDLPGKEIREFLALYAVSLRLADQAARCDHCDWELPLPTLQNMQDLPLDEVQTCREIATLLNLRCRLELSEEKFDDALYTLQTGFTLARQVGNGDTLINNLVGIAIAAIMSGRVEEMMQLPGSPNLFWALTALPSPFIDVRHAFQVEMNTIHRSFPTLRELDRDAGKKPLSVKEADALVETLLRDFQKYEGSSAPAWQSKAGLTLIAVKNYPDAKKYLAEKGYTKEEIEALPALQAVVVYFLDQYNQTRDDTLKWLNAPTWQALPKLEEIARKASKEGKPGEGNPIIGLLMPAMSKVFQAHVRSEYLFSRLRCAEALRFYAAMHDGKAPEKLTDITDLPLPLNPYTGKGFEGLYQYQDGKGVLEALVPPPLPQSLGRRYEIGK